MGSGQGQTQTFQAPTTPAAAPAAAPAASPAGGKAGGGGQVEAQPAYQTPQYNYPTPYRQNMGPQQTAVPGWASDPYRSVTQAAQDLSYQNFGQPGASMWGAPPPRIDLESMQGPQVRESLIERGTLGLPEFLTQDQRQGLTPDQREQRKMQRQSAYEAMTPAQRSMFDQDRAFRRGNMGAEDFTKYRADLQQATPGYLDYQDWRGRAETMNTARDQWESGMQDYYGAFTPKEQAQYQSWEQQRPASGKGGGYAQPYPWGV